MSRMGYFLAILFLWGLGETSPGQTNSPKLEPTTVTLQGDKITVAKALTQLSKQSGMVVQDKRTFDQEKSLDLNLQKVPFWQAVDTLAQKAGASVSLYQDDGKVALVNGTPSLAPVKYNGIFRGMAKRLELSRDLQTGRHKCQIGVEAAWEPQYEPFYLGIKSWSVKYGPDEKGQIQQEKGIGSGRGPVFGQLAEEMSLQMPAPHRSVKEIDFLRLEVTGLVPVKMLDVKFTNLPEIINKGKSTTQEFGDISVTLKEIFVNDGVWFVVIDLDYPKDGPEFESYESWLVNNKISLQNKKNPSIRFLPRRTDQEILRLSSHQATIRFVFEDYEGQPSLGNPANWNLIYRTPGPIVETTVPLEFRNLPLP